MKLEGSTLWIKRPPFVPNLSQINSAYTVSASFLKDPISYFPVIYIYVYQVIFLQ